MVSPRPPYSVRDRNAEEPEIAHLLHDGFGDRVGLRNQLFVRAADFSDEAAHRFDQLLPRLKIERHVRLPPFANAFGLSHVREVFINSTVNSFHRAPQLAPKTFLSC
jgi:hypothetical protein